MIKTRTTISNKLGLHARASAKLTKLAASFPCEVWISRGERRDIRDQGYSRLLIGGVQKSCRATCAALDNDMMPRGDELGGCVWDERHAALARESFTENSDLHRGNPIAPSELGRKVRPIRRTPHRRVHKFCNAVFRDGRRPPALNPRANHRDRDVSAV